ncbi:MAG: hypothetical protein COS88_06140 [Chloroflexi bacterium CG07_land_8_20_14_0_80_51_10]|nr:MAG: hypothetical protein COS88_06140 [Chloroflexi bacterium CG07_land_8_20_14_0_80_51_10]
MTSIFFNVRSKFGKTIRLTKTIWHNKILVEHPEFGDRDEYVDQLRETIEHPEYIVKGWTGEYLALRWCEIAPKSPKYLCVVYRELNNEGFIITAFFISKYEKLLKRGIAWREA